MTKQALDRLRSELDQLRAQRSALDNQIAAMERAYALVEGADQAPAPPQVEATQRRPRMAIKDQVLALLAEHEAGGLNAGQIVEIAASRGITLDRASVSSLLSRLKKENVLSYDGSAYRPSVPTGGGGNVASMPRHAA